MGATASSGGTATATVAFAQTPARYGHALRAQVWLDNKLVGEGRDYFNICNNFWNVALIDGIGPGSGLSDATSRTCATTTTIPSKSCSGRRTIFSALTPDTDSWLSGQARYAEAKTGVVDFPHWGKIYGLKDGIALAHKYGIKVVTYAKLTGGGTYGMEMARKHPEMVWQNEGTLSVIRAAESRANGTTATRTTCRRAGCRWITI